MGNIHVKLYEIWSGGSGGGEDFVQRYFLSGGSGGRFVQWSRTICAILVKGIMRNNSVNLIQIWASGSGGDVV